MSITTLSSILIFTFTLPVLRPTSDPTPLSAPAPISAEIELGDMRASAARNIEPLSDQLRAELVDAADESLADMRAGTAPSDREWGWIGVGAIAAVLLIVLL